MSDAKRDGWSDWDAENHGLECEAGVGFFVEAWTSARWLSWDETVALHDWLGRKIVEATRERAP